MGFHHSILVTHPFPNINHIQTPPPTCSHHHRPTRLTGAKKKRSRKGGHHLTLEPFSLKKNPWKELTCRKSLAGWKDSPKKKAFLMPIDYPLFLVTNSWFFLGSFRVFFFPQKIRDLKFMIQREKIMLFFVGFLLVQDPSVFSDRCVSFAGALCTNRNIVQVHPTCLQKLEGDWPGPVCK